MMPIFFNVQSHLWIAYLFFFNGILLCFLLKSRFKSFETLAKPFEAVICFSLVFSISINALILLLLDSLNYQFSQAIWALGFLSVVLLTLLGFQTAKNQHSLWQSNKVDWSYLRLVFYASIFIVLFYNGGMIEQLTDAWWHMSLVNKIAMASSFTPELGHLTGAPARYYPPLWHGNLALAHTLSSETIPVLWNSLTAWMAVVKVMAFYCLAFALSKDKQVALGSVILFVLLPGIGNSYLRVSAWPSHVAYSTWYLTLAVFASIVINMPKELVSDSKWSAIKNTTHVISSHWLSCLMLLVLVTVINFTHQTELLWFCVAVFAYLCTSSISRALSKKEYYLAFRDHTSLRLAYRLMLIVLMFFSLRFANDNLEGASLDLILSLALPIIILSVFFLLEFKFISRNVKGVLLLLLAILVFASLHYTHLLSLFFPEMSVPRGIFHESPSSVAGYYGGSLDLPSWRLQLRAGLLYSGIISIPLSIALLILRPSPASLFICGSAVMVLLFCSSPYLYQWLKSILNYHSPWRIAVLVFHPIILMVSLLEMLKTLKGNGLDESKR